MRNKILPILFIVFVNQIAFAQNFDKLKLDKYFDMLERNNKFMGSVAVSKNGEIIYSKTTGFADIENKIKTNKNSKYRIGSISKTFTSVLILKAFEEKKLDLQQTIDKYFPTIKNAHKITIENLLNHRSGIHNFTNDEDYFRWNTRSKTEEEMIEVIRSGGSDFEPNSQSGYSNSNFVLLTYILEKAFNKSYAELLKTYIVEPLGLQNTFWGGRIKISNNECKSYSFDGIWKLEPQTDISISLGAGGIVSTPSDLLKFSNALFKGEILKEEQLEMMKKIKDGYGIGLFQIPFYDKKSYGHTGGIDGFSAIFSYFPDDDVAYVLLSNGSNYNNNNVSIAVLSAVFHKPYNIPRFSSYKVSSSTLDKYLGVYSSTQIDLKMTITKKNNTLIAQATGQSAFPLEATEKDEFKFEQAGIVLEFFPEQNTMILKQNEGKFTFTKE